MAVGPTSTIFFNYSSIISTLRLDFLLNLVLRKDAQKTPEPVLCPLLAVLVHFQREFCINEDSKCVPAFHNYRETEVLFLYYLLFGGSFGLY